MISAMNRILSILAGPEAAMVLLTAVVFLFCSRHGSYSSRDVELLERLMWVLPVVAVPLAYATIFVPGAKSWWWLGRVNVALFAALIACALKVVAGFGAPGSGPKGQDVGLLVVVCLGLILAAIANAIAGSMILAEHKPAFAEWFRARRVVGSILTGLAAVPIALIMALGGGVLTGVFVFFSTLFKR